VKRKTYPTAILTAVIAAALAGGCSRTAAPQPNAHSAPAATSRAGGTTPFDRLYEAYAPYMAPDDPLAFPMKFRAVAANQTGLWRGGKDLFFQWCRDHANDWLDDRDAYVTQQGDQHLGNVGTYLAAGEFGTLAFGMVDFDDSHRLPFQYELLQGVISLRLTAAEAGLHLDDAAVERLVRDVSATYAAAATSNATATAQLRDMPDVAKLLQAADKREYTRELADFTRDGKFVPVRATKKELKDVLRPALERADELAAGIAEAVERSPSSAALFRLRTADEFRAAMKDAVQRTRIGSAGSQGLKKYFVLLDRPLAGVDHDVIVYVKQEIPSAAERAGLVPPDPRDPAQRCAEDAVELTDPHPFFSGWCRIGGESYWVSLREPWTDELDGADVKTAEDLAAAARAWATAAGASHRGSGKAAVVAARLTPELSAQLRQLSDAYLAHLRDSYRALMADPRTSEMVARAERLIDEKQDAAPPKEKKPRRGRRGA
jgi:uncharacterized protein (DUF2252 family)